MCAGSPAHPAHTAFFHWTPLVTHHLLRNSCYLRHTGSQWRSSIS